MDNIIGKVNSLSQGFEVYAVGGFSRDLFLKRKCKDIDLAVNKNALSFSKKIAKAFKSKLVVLDETRKTYRIILKDANAVNIDVSLFAGKDIKEDLKNRDFTINATAFKLQNFANFKKHIISSNPNDLKDLKFKIINAMSDKSFKSDPLRMLRAFRFAGELNFVISKETVKQVKRNAKLIRTTAPERIKSEFFRILDTPNASVWIKEIDKCGLLSEIFPEIKKMKKARRKYYYHKGGGFQHSFKTMQAAENILNNLNKYFPESFLDLKKHFNDNAFCSENVSIAGLLKFAALFHDNAKPETARLKNGKMHFFEHDKLGSEKIKDIALSVKLSKKDTEYVSFLIKHHMRPSTLTRNNVITKKATLKFFRDIADYTPDLLVLSMADWHSYKSLKFFSTKRLKSQENAVREFIKLYYELKNTPPPVKIINGDLIMKKFDLKPGPLIGRLLASILEAQQEGIISKREEALKLISSQIASGAVSVNLAKNK